TPARGSDEATHTLSLASSGSHSITYPSCPKLLSKSAKRQASTHEAPGSSITRGFSGQPFHSRDSARRNPLSHIEVAIGIKARVVRMNEPARTPLALVAANGELAIGADP